MKVNDPKLKTFCPLPWNHLSVGPEGKGRVCCDGYDFLKDDSDNFLFWKEVKDIHSYFNSRDYKKIRQQMLKGERPAHCYHCFNQEDHGVKSIRLQYIDQYSKSIKKMIKSTNSDGSVIHPKIDYIDMALGNNCNLKCRMCSPWNSYIIGKDWEQLGIFYHKESAKKIFKDKWYSSPNTFKLLKQALPNVKAIFTTGGEPLIIKEHLQILEMIVEEGYADKILLRYNSNQTVIPNKIVEMWKLFKTVQFNCSVEAYGELNSYIRYPSQWKKQEENIYYLDQLALENKNIQVFIHTTLQAYNVLKLPQFLNFLRQADFKKLNRFPFFILVRKPEYLNPCIFPKDLRINISNNILNTIDKHERFFLNCNKDNLIWIKDRIKILREFCEMIKNDDTQEKNLSEFIIKTKQLDKIRNQSVLDVLPELKEYFS